MIYENSTPAVPGASPNSICSFRSATTTLHVRQLSLRSPPSKAIHFEDDWQTGIARGNCDETRSPNATKWGLPSATLTITRSKVLRESVPWEESEVEREESWRIFETEFMQNYDWVAFTSCNKNNLISHRISLYSNIFCNSGFRLIKFNSRLKRRNAIYRKLRKSKELISCDHVSRDWFTFRENVIIALFYVTL